jgi:hypothetical protein
MKSSTRLTRPNLHEIEQLVLTSLTLAGAEAAPVITAKTSWIAHPAQSYHGLSGFGAGTSPAQQYPTTYAKVNAELTIKLFSLSNKLGGRDLAVVQLAVGRLRRSRLHESPPDRAIDLGAALEMLTLENGQRQELAFRVSVRAARMLGTDPAQRSIIFKTVKDAYDARSAAVHTGKLAQRHVDVLRPADQVCVDLAKEVIGRSGFPKNWDELVLA